MNDTNHQAAASDPDNATEGPAPGPARDWPSILMIAASVLVIAWCFWPSDTVDQPDTFSVAVGKTVPPLSCVDPTTGEPLLGLVPRGWFVWIVIGPDSDNVNDRLSAELALAETTWKAMADLDRWRRVVVTPDESLARELQLLTPQPAAVPFDVGLMRNRSFAVWGRAERVRHVLVEPSGRILMIEPAESNHPGALEKIHQDLRRRLRQWEGEFDDLPRFS